MKKSLALLLVTAAVCGCDSRRTRRVRKTDGSGDPVAASVDADADADTEAPTARDTSTPKPEPKAEPAKSTEAPPKIATEPPATGAIQEVWTGVAGNSVPDFTSSERYRGSPDEVRALSELAFGAFADAYGSRTTALVCPPETGEYTFWIASDDGGELWLSSDETDAACRLVAKVPNYSPERGWTTHKSQQSDPVRLEKGKRYLLKALQKEGGGVDHMSVAWSGPGIERDVIPGKHLIPPKLGPEALAAFRKIARDDVERVQIKADVIALIEKGETLPVELTKRLPRTGPVARENDTGINVLLDQAHQTSFATLWGFKGHLWRQGFRVATSVATINTVLEPGKPSRVRYGFAGMEPFAWWPNPEFNVVITVQKDRNAQMYTPDERAALKSFVESGGGLLVLATAPRSSDEADKWSMNLLAGDYGARFTKETFGSGRAKTPILTLTPEWEVVWKAKGGEPVRARRSFGKGRVMVWGTDHDLLIGKTDDDATKKAKTAEHVALLKWLAAGKPPVGGDPGMPGGGGVNIFPERELRLEGINVYYADNQNDIVRNCLEKQVPEAYEQVRRWLPSKVFAEPYNMVICAGGGGGWAIGSRPKGSAIITYKPDGILSVMAHEVAHTIGGPRNAKGELAGRSPHHNQGEAHAGWFQGKANAKYTGGGKHIGKANRGCNSILGVEKKAGEKIDLAKYDSKKWGKGKDWTKYWWVWQKIEDRYGATWYTRWYWVRSVRWQDEPDHKETFDEMVEDMSIAVGEDLFPFFKKIGTTLEKPRLERIEFMGKMMELAVAPIDTGPAGAVNLEEIGDYTKPLVYKK
jgi:hypothetical protein